MLLAAAGPSLAPRVRVSVLAGLGLIAGLGVKLHPQRVIVKDLLVAGQLNAVAYVGARGWGLTLNAAANELQDRYHAERSTRSDGAFQAGGESVLDLVDAGITDLEQRFTTIGADLVPSIRDEAQRRLNDLRKRLTALRADPGTDQQPTLAS